MKLEIKIEKKSNNAIFKVINKNIVIKVKKEEKLHYNLFILEYKLL